MSGYYALQKRRRDEALLRRLMDGEIPCEIFSRPKDRDRKLVVQIPVANTANNPEAFRRQTAGSPHWRTSNLFARSHCHGLAQALIQALLTGEGDALTRSVLAARIESIDSELRTATNS